MLKIGLTGGIASGKTTVAEMFSELGAGVIDTDVIAREVVAPGSVALERIVASFGPEVLAADGSLDRPRLRRIVFADSRQRAALEAILHPLIRRRALELAEASTAAYVVLAVPLLFESGFDALVDRSVVVDCPVEHQLERVRQRDAIGEDEARAIVAAQMPRDARRAKADDVIDNSGDIAATRAQVATLHEAYLQLAQNCRAGQGRAE